MFDGLNEINPKEGGILRCLSGGRGCSKFCIRKLITKLVFYVYNPYQYNREFLVFFFSALLKVAIYVFSFVQEGN